MSEVLVDSAPAHVDRAAEEPNGRDSGVGGSPLIRRLFSESAIYGLGTVAGQGLNVVLVPLYAHVLGISAYGVVSILNTTLLLVFTLAGFALPQAFFRFYLHGPRSDGDRRQVVGVSLVLRVIASASGAVLLTLAAWPLATVLLGESDQWALFALLAIVVFFDTLQQATLQYLRANREPRTFVVLSMGRAALAGVAIVVLIVPLGLGLLGVVLGQVMASVASAIVAVALLVRREGAVISWDRPLATSMLAFAAPLVPVALAGWALNVSDRYLLAAFSGTEVVGIYSLGYAIGMAINILIVQPFTLAWAASQWDAVHEDAGGSSIVRTSEAFVVIATFAAVGVSAFGIDVMRLLFPRGSELARYVVPFSAFGYLLFGVQAAVTTGLYVAGRTAWVSIATMIAATTNLGLNLVLIPRVGFMGAALSTVVGYGVLAVAGGLASQRVHPYPFRFWPLALPIAAGSLLAAAAVVGPDHVLWRVLCVVAYTPILLMLRGHLRPEGSA